jgi:O-antigen ligase
VVAGAVLGRTRRSVKAAGLKLVRDPLRISLVLLTIINVSRVHQHFPLLAKLHPALALAGLIGMYVILNPRYVAPQGLFKSWPAKLVLALAFWALIGMPFGVSLGGSAAYVLDEFSKSLIFAALLTVAIRNARDLYTLVWAYVVSSGILVWLSWFVFGIHKHAGTGIARLSSGYTFDANDIGLVLLIGAGLTLLVMQASGRRGRILCLLLLIAIGATIARTGSRGAFLGLLVTGATMLLLLSSISVVKRTSILVATLIALAFAAPAGYWEQMGTISDPTQDYNWTAVNGRKQVIQRGIGYMISYPVFGVGINNFWRMECILGEKAKDHVWNTGLRCTPPHNSYLQAGAELGLPGLLMWSSLVFGGIISMFRLHRRMPKAWARGDAEQRFLYLAPQYLMLSMVSFAVTSFFLTFAWLDMVYMLAAYMAGLYVAIGDRVRREQLAASGVAPAPAPGRGRPAVRGGRPGIMVPGHSQPAVPLRASPPPV